MPRPISALALVAVFVVAWSGLSGYVAASASPSEQDRSHAVSPVMPGGTPTPPARRNVSPTPPPPPIHTRPLSIKDIPEHCGWSWAINTPAIWSEAKVSMQLPTSVQVNTPATVVLYLKSLAASPVQAKLVLCPAGLPMQIEGQSSWDLYVAPGQIVSTTTTVRFSQTGVFDLFSGSYDVATREFAGDVRRIEVNSQALKDMLVVNFGWEGIIWETFDEPNFPVAGWSTTDERNDTYDRRWGTATSTWVSPDNGVTYYFATTGQSAAWPGAGGSDRIIPPSSNPQYADNLDTRLVYGPFNLGTATIASLQFDLWYEIETGFDWLKLEFSHDGVTWNEVNRWSRTDDNRGFYTKTFQSEFNPYLGDDSVWIAWNFHSDGSYQYRGPWVDSVYLQRYVPPPGQVTASGQLTYVDEFNNIVPAAYVTTWLVDKEPWDLDGEGTKIAGAVTTDVNGNFTIGPVTNWNYSEGRRYNLEVRWEASTQDSASSSHRVEDTSGNLYYFRSRRYDNAQDGNLDFGAQVPLANLDVKALWLLRDFRRAWEYFYANAGQTHGTVDPGSLTLKWQRDVNSYGVCPRSCYVQPENATFIEDLRVMSRDIVVHETGHAFMANYNGVWTLGSHTMWSETNSNLAWTEGWADFVALAVNGDVCFAWDASPCGAQDAGLSVNLEWHSRNDQPTTTYNMGPNVEGRVAGALWDMVDGPDDGYDTTVSYPFWSIWRDLGHAPWSFADFWGWWQIDPNDKHGAVKAMYQNSIDYDTAPTVGPFQSILVFRNRASYRAIDLWSPPSSHDNESSPQQLAFWIFQAIPLSCGASISSNRYLDLVPTQNFEGQCDVVIAASDGIKAGTGSVTVRVQRPASESFLPFVVK